MSKFWRLASRTPPMFERDNSNTGNLCGVRARPREGCRISKSQRIIAIKQKEHDNEA